MERLKIQEGFMILKPLCDALMKEPNIKCVVDIRDCIKSISDAVIQDLYEYILLPVTVHLQNDTISKRVKEHLVEIIKTVILKVRIKDFKYFMKLYTILLLQIYDKSQPKMVIPEHEELKVVVVFCIKELVHHCFTDVLEELYIRKHTPKLAQGIYLSLSIAKYEKSRSLRLVAIEAIMALCQVDEASDRSDIILQNQIADTIMLFLPGVASGLLEVALGNDIQGHKVTIMAIRAWARVISLVLQDSTDQEDVPSVIDIKKQQETSIDPLGISLRSKGAAGMEEFLKSAKRNREWLEAAASKLNILIRELNELRKHSHYKVRKELVTNIALLLTTCSRTMKSSIMELIEYLISLSEDDIEEVSEEAKRTLDKLNISYMQNLQMRPLVELLEETFYKLLTKLPRIVRSSDDGEQLACLNQLCGYLRLFGNERLPIIMQSAAHVRRLLLALVYVIEIDYNDISLLEDMGIKDLETLIHYGRSYLWRQFRFIQSTFCKEKIFTICELLGKYGDLRILVDNILDIMIDAPQHRKELTFLLNSIINVPLNAALDLSLYKEIIEFYITDEFWYLPIEVTENIPLRVAQSNVAQCCLTTEGLGQIAKNLKQDYEKFLLKTLYLIIERAGSVNSLISYIGIQTLQNIAESQGQKTIGNLLQTNVDYFSYHVTIKLRRVERNPGVLDVVGVVMKYSTMDVLPCLKEIVQDVLQQLNTTFQKRNAYSFLKVFYVFIICIKKMVQKVDKITQETKKCLESSKESPAETIIQNLLKYYETKKIDEKIEENIKDREISENPQEEDNIEMNMNNINEQEETPKPLPTHIQMVEDVLKRCLHFLPSNDIKKSLIAMLTLEEGLHILVEWEDRLLPIVHQLWHPLVGRFQEQNVLVINRAWQLLRTLAHVSKDFIRSRTLKEILPALSTFLSNSAKESYTKDCGTAYKFTQTFKLLKELLTGLSQIVKDMKLHEKDVWKILSIAEPYLNARQHLVLQACCVSMYKEIADYNDDIVWVKCLSIWHSKVKKISSDETFDLSCLKITQDLSTNEYHKNIKTIITYIQNKNAKIS